jgi:hypothetical protein
VNRRRFIRSGTIGAAALAVAWPIVWARPAGGQFKMALAGLPGTRRPTTCLRTSGGTANAATPASGSRTTTCAGPGTAIRDPDQGFGGNWRLFNLFDFTRSRHWDRYAAYLRRLDQLCARHDLHIYASFWLPKLNAELTDYLERNLPAALGTARHKGASRPTFCTSAAGPPSPAARESNGRRLAASS